MKELDDFTAHIESLFSFKRGVAPTDSDTFAIALGIVVGRENQVALADVGAAMKSLLNAVADSFDRAFEGLRGQYEMQWFDLPAGNIGFDDCDWDMRVKLPPDARKVKLALWMSLRIPNLPDAIKTSLFFVPENGKMTFLNQ